MNSIRQRRAVRWEILLIGAAALAISPLLGDPAHAVTITGTTYASESGGPTPNPTSASYNMTNLSSVSANIRSDVADAHAESYASASVGANGVTKTTGGLAWVTVTSPASLYDPRGDLWNASATGTVIQANYTPSGSLSGLNTAPFQFSLPASIFATSDPFYSTPITLSTDPPTMVPPLTGVPTSMQPPVTGTGMNQKVAQGVVANGVGSSLPSFFDIFVDVDATAYNGIKGAPGVTGTSLFSGMYEFNPSTGAYTPSGNFVTDVFGHPAEQPTITPSSDPNTPGYSLTFQNDILGGLFGAQVGSPFTVEIETSEMMGDPNNPTATFDFSGLNDPQGQLGVGGSVTGAFLLTDQSDFSVSAVPEPSAFCLAAFAAVGLLLGLRRRK
jgi:hypothetical protein